VEQVFLPQLTTPTAIDAAALIDRILVEFIVEEEAGTALSADFGGRFASALELGASDITPQRFDELRQLASEFVATATAAAATDPTELLKAQQLVQIEYEFLERVETLRQALFAEDQTVPDEDRPEDCSVTTRQLTTYLRHKLPASPDLTVSSIELVPGGRSKETILVALAGTNELPSEVVVRKDRPIGLLPTKAADEFAVLGIVYNAGGIPVPRPLFADAAPKRLGEGTLLVMERVAGAKAGEYFADLAAPPEQHRHALGLQLAKALARLHSLSPDQLSATGLGAGDPVTAESMTAAVEGMTARIADLSGPPIAAVPLARRWLLDHVGDVTPSGRMCLLQGDVGLHNMLVEEDRLTALVDWEAATVGPPARELAAAYPTANALLPWDEFVAAYLSAGGPSDAVDRRAIAFYRLFFSLGACMTSRTGGHLFRTGVKRDLLTAHSGLDAHFRTQRNLARALKDATAGT
jgi:aminoglycoside phosphotransferase (APT) family kinase protein